MCGIVFISLIHISRCRFNSDYTCHVLNQLYHDMHRQHYCPSVYNNDSCGDTLCQIIQMFFLYQWLCTEPEYILMIRKNMSANRHFLPVPERAWPINLQLKTRKNRGLAAHNVWDQCSISRQCGVVLYLFCNCCAP